MKKKFLLFIPLLSLVACGNQTADAFVPFFDYVDGLPTFHQYAGEHTTYLMMSQFGYLENDVEHVKGEVTDLFYENTIVWKAEAGSELPFANVKSEVDGATFRGWAYYNEDNSSVLPDYYTTVPLQSGLALKAIFDGKTGPQGEETGEGFGLKFSDGKKYKGAPKGINMDGKDEYLCSAVTFTAGQSFSLYDFKTTATWIVGMNPYSFGDTTGSGTNWKSYLNENGTSWSIKSNFTADVYIQILYQQDSIYIELV